MVRVALDLRRASLVALDEQAHTGAGKRHGRRVEERLAGDELFGLPDVGKDLLCRLPGAGRDTGQRQRSAHQLQESAPADRIEPLGGVLRKLPVQELLELGRLGDRLETAPVLAATAAFELGAERLDVNQLRHERVTDGTSSSWCWA